MQWLAEICVRRPVFATMLILSLVVLGGFSFFSLGVDLFPRVDLPTVVITTVNPGASPQEIETEVSDKIEASVNTISGIDELRSNSSEGVSTVIATFILEKNGDVAAQEVRDKVNLIIRNLPDTIEQPIIQKIDPDATPVVRIVVSGPGDLREVTDIADQQIVRRIETVGGVGQVNMIGGGTREIQIQIDPEKIRGYGLTFTDVANAVRQQNLEVPGGRVNQGGTELTLRTMGRIGDPEQFNDIAVATRGTFVIRVRDIGRAVDTIEEPRTAARLNSVPAVTLTVQKQSGQNTVAIARGVKQRLAEIQPTLPPGFRTEIVGDQSVFIEASLHAIEEHLIIGGILAAVVVFFFLWNFRATIISAVAIPTSIIATFAVMWAMNYTLNQITMLALTLMVGIVIDDAIVVLENIFRFIEEKGMSPFQAAIEGTKEIGLAVLATTLSLMAVFLPVGFMGGIVGRFMSSFGLTAAAAIGVSLLVSFTLTPMLAARLIKGEDTEDAVAKDEVKEDEAHQAPHKESKQSGFYSYIDRSYTWLLRWSMAHRWAIVGLCILVVISIVPLFALVGKNFLPVDDQSQFEISVRTAEGSTLPATTTIVERIAADVRRQIPGVSDTLVTVGGGQTQTVNTGSIYVKLVPIEQRSQTQDELMIRARQMLTNYPKELRTSVQAVAAISGGGQRNASVQYFIGGPDIEKLSQYSETLLEKMKSLPDVVDADTSLVVGKPELRAEIDRARAADLGVRVGDVANALNALVAGQEISTFNVGTDQYNVRLIATGQYRTSAEGLQQFTVASSKGGTVSLDQVVHFTTGSGPSSIDRLNRQRQVTLSSNVRPGGSQSNVITQMNQAVADLKLEPGYVSGVAGQSKELGRAGFYFLLAISMSFIFMYIVLAAQFESFIHPVTILLTLPLSIPFGILSLLITNQTVNIFSGLGLLLLFGVVKKNAILQIDHTNGLRAHGMSRYDAIIQANRDRLRPILMTTIALVAGMLPLVISTGAGAGTNRSIGALVVGGQTLCLLLTLLAVPVFYSLFEDLGESRAWRYIGGAYRKVSGAAGERFSNAWAGIRQGFSRKTKEEDYAEQEGK
jgi:hydrophobic/amphiphilic exporter-1 (mainly G- bacteria), HAE1 family